MATATANALDELLKRDNTDGIDPNQSDDALDALLRDIQGNVLKSHGRDHSTHLFVSFDNVVAARNWLVQMAGRVTSAHTQWEDSRRRTELMAAAKLAPTAWEAATAEFMVRRASAVFVNVLLSASGYRKLGLKLPEDNVFRAGAKKHACELNDPPCGQWEQGFQRDLHAVVMVAEDDPAKMHEKVGEIVALLATNSAGTVVLTQKGAALRTDEDGVPTLNGPPREQFGFVDGIAQPLFFKKDIDEAKSASSNDQYDPSAPLNLVLAKEPGRESCGSYVVYRKLRQHVDRFRRDRNALAHKLKEQDGNGHESKYYDDLAGAYMMGRFTDGTPVIHRDTPGDDRTDDFDYGTAPTGDKCPLQAHIRKTNPRGETSNPSHSTIRIARRGVTYDDTEAGGNSTKDVGLLFLCVQASIQHQFVFMQQMWANNQNFVKGDVGLDPVIGQSPKGTEPLAQAWPTKYGTTDTVKCRVGGDWVELRGAEYFFAPSLSFLSSCNQKTA